MNWNKQYPLFFSLIKKSLRSLDSGLFHQSYIQERNPTSNFLHVSSYGGSLLHGLAGMDAILQCKSPMVTIVDGCCASAATFLSVCGKKRYINRHAYMLIHQLSSVMWGKYEEFKDEMQNLDKLMTMIKNVYKEYTKIPMEKIEKVLKHNLWFSAEECKEFGLVD